MSHPVDVHIGKRIRHRRWIIGMTQQQLAEKIGIEFQQIQKYETGANRISAYRLWDISGVLQVSVSYFFQGPSDELRAESEPREPNNGDLADKEICDLLNTLLKS